MKNLGFLQHVHQEHLGQNISQISWLNFNQQIWMTGTVIAVITLRMHFTRTIINQLVEQQFMSSLVSRTFRFFTIFILQRWKNSINTIWFLGFHIIQNRCVLSFICFTVFKSQRSKMHSKLKKLHSKLKKSKRWQHSLNTSWLYESHRKDYVFLLFCCKTTTDGNMQLFYADNMALQMLTRKKQISV